MVNKRKENHLTMNELKRKGHSNWGIMAIPVSLIVAVSILFTGCAAESTNLKNLQASVSKETAERKKDVKELKTLIDEGLAGINHEVAPESHEKISSESGTSTDTHAAAAITNSKPSPEEIVNILKEGNARFVAGTSTYPNTGSDRLALAATENQANYAYATVLSCSDSRVPPELIFDAGIMDLFIVRVAGNVADTDGNRERRIRFGARKDTIAGSNGTHSMRRRYGGDPGHQR
jgi:hypothetical protein